VVRDIEGALLWLRSTFFFVRVRQNPRWASPHQLHCMNGTA
jgi:hypothetical protein